MTAKVTINWEQIKLKRPACLWNSLTPTRGAKRVANQLSELSTDRDVTVSVDRNGLYSIVDGETQNSFVLYSATYARTLQAAGVTEIIIPKGSSARGIKYLLDTLSDHLIGGSSNRLVQIGFHIQLEGNMNRLT